MKSELLELIEKKNGKARRNSVFWKELMQEIKEKGSRAVGGVKGQFASFEKIQPG
jgi:general stress protein YciG